jgi:integrase/recombinase XerD
MAVNLRKKYYGKKEVSKKNRPYRFQLDYSHQGKRVRETIKDVEFLPTDTKEIRKQKERIVNKIKADLEIDLANQSNGLISRQLKKASFIKYFQSIADTKSSNTKGSWNNTLKHIEDFHGSKLKFEDVTERWLERFSDYLSKRLSQNSTRTYLQKVNTALNQAVKQKVIIDNPFKYVSKLKKEETEMVYLSKDEIQEIINTPFFDDEVKNAFLFGCYTGLRYSDIESLKWSNIKDNQIQLTQTKTKGAVYIPLNSNAEHILTLQSNTTTNIFKLSRFNSSVNRTLKKLISKTSIKKDVSFHTSRHTFATILISSGVNVYTVSKLLGHKDIDSTLVYAKVISEEKEKAVNSMPNFEF